MDAKRIAAERAADYIQDGMVVGLGTGSTAYWAIQRIGQRVQEGLRIRAIATSNASEKQAKELGIPLISFADVQEIDLTIDGADEVDPNFQLIKGGGGALLREKIVASSSSKFIVIVDDSKLVGRLGRFPLPIEIVRFGYEATIHKLRELGCEPVLREVEGKAYITDNGNYIVDAYFGAIADPKELESKLNMIPGVVENGLFVDMADRVIAGKRDGGILELERQR
ncbi:ribose-5-phosphate isomerase A [Insulibacter thermoxylanivorax]|uniref:Ribose-5-phosphate isomerase A n=1 Tax=Insulibacter thermoxylanivorax TaxID=2749268 RepID=A0A916QEJ6_9BACL|nr:ribose-5-phosphate isomerase RpiA [Insulibacter thermoxylanivorax]GFR37623.1 ribose-5-phosphate isomerase A [Insulibacter thermoxylanivorax]